MFLNFKTSFLSQWNCHCASFLYAIFRSIYLILKISSSESITHCSKWFYLASCWVSPVKRQLLFLDCQWNCQNLTIFLHFPPINLSQPFLNKHNLFKWLKYKLFGCLMILWIDLWPSVVTILPSVYLKSSKKGWSDPFTKCNDWDFDDYCKKCNLDFDFLPYLNITILPFYCILIFFDVYINIWNASFYLNRS